MVGTFARLKWRLLRNGIRRTTRNPVAAIGFVVAVLGSVVASVIGLVLMLGLRGYWDPLARQRILGVAVPALVFGWWFGPLLTGGVDETVDPVRLVLLPIGRRDLRRGQIVAGLIGLAPTVVVVWSIAMAVGMVGDPRGAPLVVGTAALVPLCGLMGSRAVSSTLARWSRTRRGGDVAALVAALGGAAVFGALQMIRFIEPGDLDPIGRALEWTPPGLAATGIRLARDGRVLDAAWRVLPLLGLTSVLGWWWSRQVDALLADPSQLHGSAPTVGDDPMAIFARSPRWLPRSPAGAAVAKELIYLRRSPGRRTTLFAGTALGLVYVVVLIAGGGQAGRIAVLASPVAMLFSVQYASNQLGVDPAAFWLEVATGPPRAARWTGRQFLAAVNVVAPVIVAAVTMGFVTGGWVEVVATLVATVVATPAIVGVGSLMSPVWVTPLPDSGNPFAANQSAGGNGCMAGIVALLYVALVAVLIGPASVGLWWAFGHAPIAVAGVALADVVLNGAIWVGATRAAVRLIEPREAEVLAKLDARLNQ